MKKLPWMIRQIRDVVRWLRFRKSYDASLVIIGATFDLNEADNKAMRDLLESLAINKGFRIQ